MDDALQRPPPVLVGEHQPAHGRAIQFAGRGQYLRPEFGHHLGQSVGAGTNDLPSQGVGVDDDRAKLGQAARHGRLARSDATGEPDHEHGLSLASRRYRHR